MERDGGVVTADDLQGLGAYEVVCQLFAQGTTQAPATGRTRSADATALRRPFPSSLLPIHLWAAAGGGREGLSGTASSAQVPTTLGGAADRGGRHDDSTPVESSRTPRYHLIATGAAANLPTTL